MGVGVQAFTSVPMAIETGIPLTHQPVNPLLHIPLGCCCDHYTIRIYELDMVTGLGCVGFTQCLPVHGT